MGQDGCITMNKKGKITEKSWIKILPFFVSPIWNWSFFKNCTPFSDPLNVEVGPLRTNVKKLGGPFNLSAVESSWPEPWHDNGGDREDWKIAGYLWK
jgi:hypothetical protein